MPTAVEEQVNPPKTGGRDPDLVHIIVDDAPNALCGLPVRQDERLSRRDFDVLPCMVCHEIDRAQRIRAGL